MILVDLLISDLEKKITLNVECLELFSRCSFFFFTIFICRLSVCSQIKEGTKSLSLICSVSSVNLPILYILLLLFHFLSEYSTSFTFFNDP